MSVVTSPATGQPEPPSTPDRRPRRLRAFLIGTVIAAALAVFLFVGLGTGPGGSPNPVAGVGSVAPNFSLPRLGGGTPVDLESLGVDRHRPVVLNFFASWCIPCIAETPLLAATATAEQAKGSSVQFVGVDVADQPSAALAFVQNAGIAYPVGADRDLQVSSTLYGLVGQPDTIFIDASGHVIGRHLGALDATQLQSWLKRLNASGG